MRVVRAADIELTDIDLGRAAAMFGIEKLAGIGGFENLLYRSTVPPGRILRLSHTSRRSKEMIEAEFNFVDHLSSQGVSAVAPILSQTDALVEEFLTEAGDRLAVVCMTEAPGSRRRPLDWSDSDIEAYGALLGAMHESAATHLPASEGSHRPPWTDPIFDVGLATASQTRPALLERMAEVFNVARVHPAGAADLLIHRDLHIGNLFMTDAGAITAFDFDDAAYGTATHDVAIVLFYWMFGQETDPLLEAQRFLSRFMNGYERHARLPRDWPGGADLFLSHREIEICWLLSMEATATASPGSQRFMNRRLERVLDGVPYLGVALSDFIEL